MRRRDLLKGLTLLGLCPACAAAAEGAHWSYEGGEGPGHWGDLAKENAACSAGSQQSPVNLSGAIDAKLPEMKTGWRAAGGGIVNNGHTIQVNVPEGSTLAVGDAGFDLVQFHFHAPSEHLVDGRAFPMEAHFVHKAQDGSGLGVVGVLLQGGGENAAFAAIAGGFPQHAHDEAEAPAGLDPDGLLPGSRRYFSYEGSLTTPPCSEVVRWMVLTEPVAVAESDIDRFTALYAGNARPVQPANRRFLLVSG